MTRVIPRPIAHDTADDVVPLNADSLMQHDSQLDDSGNEISGSDTGSSYKLGSRRDEDSGPWESGSRPTSRTEMDRVLDHSELPRRRRNSLPGLSDRPSTRDQLVTGWPDPVADHTLCMRTMFRVRLLLSVAFMAFITAAATGQLSSILNTLASLCFLVLVPYQAAFDESVQFNSLYVFGYVLDAIALYHRISSAVELEALLRSARRICAAVAQPWMQQTADTEQASGEKAAQGAPKLKRRPSKFMTIAAVASSPEVQERIQSHRTKQLRRRRQRERAATLRVAMCALKILLCLPYDAVFWGSEYQRIIPSLRCTRLASAVVFAHEFALHIERSQAVEFSIARVMRVISFFLLVSHWMGCLFHSLSRGEHSDHYAQAPWKPDPSVDQSLPARYLRSIYWSLMTLTTTGHVDIIEQKGKIWEVWMALFIAFVSTFIYIYVNANFTSIMLRMNNRMESYRTRLRGVDNYLRKNKVSKELRRLVKKHFESMYDQDSDNQILDQLPHALRREILKNIYLRSIRRVPLFFGCDSALISQIAEMLRRVVCVAGQTIIKQGDVAKELYVLESGMMRQTMRLEQAEQADVDDVSDDASVMPLESVPLTQLGSSAKLSLGRMPSFNPSVAWHHSNNDSSHSGKAWNGSNGANSSASAAAPASSSFKGHKSGSARQKSVIIADHQSAPSVVSEDEERSELVKDLDLPGMTFGDIGVVFNIRQEATYEAVIPSQCLVLQKVDFDQIVTDFVDSLDIMKRNVKSRLRQMDEKDPLLLQIEQQQLKERAPKSIAKLADMLFAAATGEVETVREALDHGGVDVNEQDYEGRNCLQIAAAAGQLAVVELLLKYRSAVNRKDVFGNSPLENAIVQGHQTLVKVLLEAKASLEWDEAKSASQLCDKAREGKLAAIQTLLECGVSVNAADYDRRTVLHLAASEGNVRLAQYLLDHGAHINCDDRWKGTPLSDAIREGHTAVAKFLIERGGTLAWDEMRTSSELCKVAKKGDIDGLSQLLEAGCKVNAADYDQRTAAHLAASEGNLSVVQYLISHGGANLNAVDRWGGTPLRDAVRQGHRVVARELRNAGAVLGLDEVSTSGELCELSKQGSVEGLRLLLDSGCTVNAKDYDKRRALHLAASEGNLPIVKLLVEKGAEVNAADRWGGTALRDAVREARPEVAQYLCTVGGSLGYDEVAASGELCELSKQGSLEKLCVLLRSGCPINAADYDKRTALHLASSEGNLPIVKRLLEEGALINSKDRWGGTPLRDAVREGHGGVAEFLHANGGNLGYDEVQTSGELCELAKQGRLDFMKVLIRAGASVNAADYDKRTALHLASSEGNIHIVKMLIDNGAQVGFKDRWGNAALQDAIREGHSQVAALLLSKGAPS